MDYVTARLIKSTITMAPNPLALHTETDCEYEGDTR
jgi:hypothetical protein